jgi:hypothetical protein
LRLFQISTQFCSALERVIALTFHSSPICFGTLPLSLAVDNRVSLFASRYKYAPRNFHRFPSITMNE